VTRVRKGEGGANEQIKIYFSQIHVYSLVMQYIMNIMSSNSRMFCIMYKMAKL